jgi:hypothetical protein
MIANVASLKKKLKIKPCWEGEEHFEEHDPMTMRNAMYEQSEWTFPVECPHPCHLLD